MENLSVNNQINMEGFRAMCIAHHNSLSEKTIQYTDFLSFLLENMDNQFIIIKEEEYNRFMTSDDDDDDEMQMKMVDYDDFYENGFEIDMWQFEDNFLGINYIDKNEDRILLAIKCDGIEKKFVVDIV